MCYFFSHPAADTHLLSLLYRRVTLFISFFLLLIVVCVLSSAIFVLVRVATYSLVAVTLIEQLGLQQRANKKRLFFGAGVANNSYTISMCSFYFIDDNHFASLFAILRGIIGPIWNLQPLLLSDFHLLTIYFLLLNFLKSCDYVTIWHPVKAKLSFNLEVITHHSEWVTSNGLFLLSF